MITQEQAFNIARSIVPDIELKGIRISDKLSDNRKLAKLPANCWYISYFPVPMNYLSCSSAGSIFLCVSKSNGEILFHNNL